MTTAERADEYQPRTRERLIEMLKAMSENPRSWQQEAAALLATPSPASGGEKNSLVQERGSLAGSMSRSSESGRAERRK